MLIVKDSGRDVSAYANNIGIGRVRLSRNMHA